MESPKQTAHKYIALITPPLELQYDLADKNCYCGIEIEVENIGGRIPIIPQIWQIKGDGSLRNDGREFVSSPLKGDNIVKALEYAFRYIPPEAHFSPRTSIHVHINVLDLTVEEAFNFLLLYLLFEKVLYRFIGKDRDRNIFCVPLQDGYRISNLLKSFKEVINNYRVEDEENRYAGLNLAALHKFGTFEFRQLGGTRDVWKILTWVNMLLSLRKFAQDKEYNEQIIFDLNTTSDYRSFLYRIFGKLSNKFNYDFIDRDMERGVYTIKYSLLKNEFQQKLVNSIDYESKAMKIIRPQKEKSLDVFNLNEIVVEAARMRR